MGRRTLAATLSLVLGLPVPTCRPPTPSAKKQLVKEEPRTLRDLAGSTARPSRIREDEDPPMTPPGAASADTPPMPPLAGAWIEPLTLADGGRAFVTLPQGARERRPVVVAVHGAYDDPGLMCSAWRLIVDNYAFVVCPGGLPAGGSATLRVWPSGELIAKRMDLAIAAARARYGDYMIDGPHLYAGFSQGANFFGEVLRWRPEAFSAVVLTEGGTNVFRETATCRRAYHDNTLMRVLYTCSQGGCASGFKSSQACLTAAGVESHVFDAGPLGHSMPPPVRRGIHEQMPWLVSPDPAWQGYARAPRLPAN